VGIRAVGWVSTALKAYLRGDTRLALVLFYTGMTSGLLPLFGLLLSNKNYISASRPFWVTAANILQFFQVGKYFDHLYPCQGSACNEVSVPLVKAFTAVVSSNGAVFLIMTAFMGSLTFKWLFVTQCIYCLILIVSNRSICIKGPALRRGYNLIHSQLVKPFFLKITPLFSSAIGSKIAAAGAAFNSTITSATTPPAESSVQRCIRSQVAVQLIFGFWLPCWIAYSRELQARKSFVKSRRGDSACRSFSFPSAFEMFMYALPSVAFPWCMFILSGTHVEY
jgi:hypothetical protein